MGEGVLCPRPDTEIIVEKALEFLGIFRERTLLDLCSGSGCIGLTMALEKPELSVLCSDIDEAPEKYFQINRERLQGGERPLCPSDLFENIGGPFSLILDKSPYLTEVETRERMGRRAGLSRH